MFEKIVLKRAEGGHPLTIGELAEALLFYQNVHLILDRAVLTSFMKSIGIERFFNLLGRPNITAVFCEDQLGVKTESIGHTDLHSFVAFTLSGDEQFGQAKNRKQRLEFLFVREGMDKKKARRTAERFMRLVPIRKIGEDFFVPGGLGVAARDDLKDDTFVLQAVNIISDGTAGLNFDLGRTRFDVMRVRDDFIVNTNLDIAGANAVRKDMNPPMDDISVANVLNELLMARADLTLAAHYGGDFSTSQTTSRIIQLRYSELLRRSGISSSEVDSFKDVVLEDSPSIREAIDGGHRTFDEFLKLLDRSDRFKRWLQEQTPDEKIVRAYFKDVTADGWLDKLPGKALKFVMGSAIGTLVDPLAELAISAADTFMLDKVVKGWRPNHFVDRRLKPFLDVV